MFGNPRINPPPAGDTTALEFAEAELQRLFKGSELARQAETWTFVLLVILGASTTLSAALGGPGALTATLAAVGVVVTSLRARFQWHQLSVGRLEAACSLTEKIQLWTIGGDAGSAAVEAKRFREVHEIRNAERHHWLTHRSDPDPTTK